MADTKLSTTITSDPIIEEDNHGGRKSWFSSLYKTKEQRLIFKLDMFILYDIQLWNFDEVDTDSFISLCRSWACFGYFLRLLDTSNMSMYIVRLCVYSII